MIKIHKILPHPHLKKRLESLRQVKRHLHHPLIHQIHKKHGISKKTLFYVKEYGPHSHVAKTIIKESIKILLLASLISSFGGLLLEEIKTIFLSLIPLVILLPTLNDMIGNYGCIFSSRFSTLLHEGKISKKWWSNLELRKMFWQIVIISLTTATLSSIVALVVSRLTGYHFDFLLAFKVFFVAVADVFFLVNILFFVAIFAGLYFYHKKEDPNNFLIPITTSIADFGNMLLLTILIKLIF